MAGIGTRPGKGINNVWHTLMLSRTVIVFVHGIFSDSRGCWYADTPDGGHYWPDLINSDPRLHGASIFLGGFYTDFDAGRYDIADCAEELYQALTTPDADLRRTVLEHDRIVFIGHSTGGIVVRYLLTKYADVFKHKEVGLLLMASPSMGSRLADVLGGLASFYNNQLALHLKWGNDLLQDLDDRFKDLLDRKLIPDLAGIEACENHFIIHRKFLPDQLYVVEKASAGRYFKVQLLRDTDHFATVKPTGKSHPAHQLLVHFWIRQYGPCLTEDVKMLLDISKDTMRERNVPYFSPAMLAALLSRHSVLGAALNHATPGSAAELLKETTHYLERTLPKAGAGPFVDFDWYSRPEVRSAQVLAQSSRDTTLHEAHLARALLDSESRSMADLRIRLQPHLERIRVEIDKIGRGEGQTPLFPDPEGNLYREFLGEIDADE
jgi:pimeloyl-ACP methyl ester carboxylesterase